MLNMCIDIIATLLEILILFILLHNDKHTVSKGQLILSGTLYFIFIRGITILEFEQTEKLFMFLISNSLIAYQIFKNPWMKSIVLGFLQLISVYLGELSIQTVILLFYKPGLSHISTIPVLFVIAILLSKVCSIICCILFKRIFGYIEYPYNWKLSFCLLFPLSFILIAMAKLQEVIFNTVNLPQVYEEIFLSVGLIISMICLLFIYQYYFKIKELQIAKNISEEQMLSIFHFYEDRRIQEENNRRIYHDIQAHIQTLENMRLSEEKENYNQDLLKQLYHMNFPFHTGVETIDIVLNEKQNICKKEGIQLICIGDFSSLNFLKPMELVTIFHNAIDNAINEYRNHDYPTKLIEIQTWTFRNFIHLRFMNYCAKPDKTDSKKKTDLHGFGLKNMADIAEHYHGEALPILEDGRFYLRIIIPLIPHNQ